ncbi:type II toxin-antitoxin system RatA family toxin [Magnetospira thiophila]
MASVVRQYRVEQPSEMLFDVAADIEAYPQFLPNCVGARIIEREDNNMLVDNLFRWGPLTTRFRSRARFDPPWEIDVRSVGPGPAFRIQWHFRPDGPGGTQVRFCMDLDLDSPLWRGMVDRVLQSSARRIEQAFRARVTQKSGGVGSSRIDR